jgi:hypothetical protein
MSEMQSQTCVLHPDADQIGGRSDDNIFQVHGLRQSVARELEHNLSGVLVQIFKSFTDAFPISHVIINVLH